MPRQLSALSVDDLLGIAATRRRRRSGARILFADDFDRADSATTLGDDWTVITGTWGITGGTAYNPSGTANALAVRDVGKADATVRSEIATINGRIGIYARVSDASNWVRLVRESSTSMLLQKCVAGSVTTIATLSDITFASHDVFGLGCAGAMITPLQNDIALLDAQSVAEHASATRFGIGFGSTSSAGGKFEWFWVTAP